ncbi:MAG TPA: DinB family protein [Bacteroidota bacterium]|nr:DinB family protein [Bacteroidota bacterium]
MKKQSDFEQFSIPELGRADVDAEFLKYSRRRLLREYLPKIERCLELLSDEDVWWRAHESNNSIGNLILHLTGNVRQWIVSGIGGAEDIRTRPQEFAERTMIPKEKLLNKLKAVLVEADAVLERFDPKHLLEVRRIQKYEMTCLDAISHVVEHFSHHTGQIIYATKLRKGMDLKFYDV